METKKEIIEKLKALENGEHLFFDMCNDGGAVAYKFKDVYLLFEIPLFGGNEVYHDTYRRSELGGMVDVALGWN